MGPELYVIVLLGAIVAQVFYLLTLQNLLKAIKEQNRKLEPSQVWLIFIPLFGLVWQFIVINRVGDSLKLELAERAIASSEDRPGLAIGITYCALLCASVLPGIGGLAALAGIVCWIIYWVKMNDYKKLLGGEKRGSDQILD